MKSIVVAILVFSGCVFAMSADDFFRPAVDSGALLDADELYPRGRKLAFTMYSVCSPQIETTKEDGFTSIGPFYGSHQDNIICDGTKNDIIVTAAKLGVKCFYTVGSRVNFHAKDGYKMPTDQEIRDAMITDVKKVMDRKEVAVWNLTNEELRYWKKDEYHWLKVATRAIRDTDPLKRPIIMYECYNRNAEMLSRTVKYLDVSYKGMYCNTAEDFKDHRIWVKWGVEQLVKAAADADHPVFPMAALWMAWDPKDPAQVELIDDWTRHDVYLSLISGAKGIGVWSAYNRRKGFENHFTDFYEGYSRAAKELNGDLNLSQVLLFGEKRDDIKIEIKSGPSELKLDYDKQVHTYSPVNILDAAYGKDRYLFMVNSANSPVKIAVSGLPMSNVTGQVIIGDTVPTEIVDGEFTVELKGLGVKVFKFKKK